MNELHTAYATQYDGGPNGRSEWIVYNTNKEEIYTLPGDWDEKSVMKAIKLGRHFELIAFNNGIKFQKEKTPQEILSLRALLQGYEVRIEQMKKENDRLATALDDHFINMSK